MTKPEGTEARHRLKWRPAREDVDTLMAAAFGAESLENGQDDDRKLSDRAEAKPARLSPGAVIIPLKVDCGRSRANGQYTTPDIRCDGVSRSDAAIKDWVGGPDRG